MIIRDIGMPLPSWVKWYEKTLRECAGRNSLWFAFLVRERTHGVKN